ncbi:MAG: hypothetical protein I8H75_00900 [Myxococcaceae bacterium]|nr:hypothetical protein [Myxococcaceae bacterium]MBH2005899.1 hypothetical protein [Myxococcaceae bacterium]
MVLRGFIWLLPAALAVAQDKRVQPFTEPPKIDWTTEQKSKLEKGELVFIERQEDRPGSRYYREGSAGFRLDASFERVWKVLGDFEKYPDWAYKIASAEDYEPAQKKDGHRYLEFKAAVVGKKYYVDHDLSNQEKGWIVWQTDHAKANDCVLDTAGVWRLEPVKNTLEKTDVFYSGKVVLNKLCAKGFLGMGGFNGQDMAKQMHQELKKRVSSK